MPYFSMVDRPSEILLFVLAMIFCCFFGAMVGTFLTSYSGSYEKYRKRLYINMALGGIVAVVFFVPVAWICIGDSML